MAERETPETTEEFMKRFGTLVTHGYLSLSVALGVKTGLFETLISLQEQERASHEIADAAGLKER